jgi:hypothetical protein
MTAKEAKKIHAELSKALRLIEATKDVPWSVQERVEDAMVELYKVAKGA